MRDAHYCMHMHLPRLVDQKSTHKLPLRTYISPYLLRPILYVEFWNMHADRPTTLRQS